MNIRALLEKTCSYISCAVKYMAAAAVSPLFRNESKYKDLWIISERGIDARDNGYYLFKYITENHPEINIAYIITKTSPDRERVSKLGRLINHNSMEHYISLVLSKMKISTHIMGYTPYINFFVRADKIGLVKGKKVFLQHGITKDNLPYLYSDNVNIDLFVCSAKPEYDYVTKLYGYREGVVQMLGMCRYDELYKIPSPSKKILVMPTWRQKLQCADKHEFMKSEYYLTFEGLLSSPRMHAMLEKYDYELMFYPHIEMQKFIDCFASQGRVTIKSFKDCTVQELLINSDVLITDFSSVLFDYAYMEKPMIFYQFDEAEFRKQHYSEGYFKYTDDAFGEVVYDEDALLDELEKILAGGAVTEEKYQNRIDAFFTIRDTNNSERNFRAIEKLLK